MTISTFRCVAIGALALACRNEPGAESDSVVAPPVAVAIRTPVPISSDSSGTSCPHNGQWSICTVERRLRQAGFVVKPVIGTPLKRAGFSVVPTVYTLGRARVELFIYADDAALSRDITGIDTITVAPRGVVTPWETTPALVRSGNLAAVLLSQNQRQVERFALAITAGAPQAGSPR